MRYASKIVGSSAIYDFISKCVPEKRDHLENFSIDLGLPERTSTEALLHPRPAPDTWDINLAPLQTGSI
jgi:hypothetical protein